mgnify:CR=1 FL=1
MIPVHLSALGLINALGNSREAVRDRLLAGVLRLDRGDARGVDPAHLAGADADGHAVPAVDDGV